MDWFERDFDLPAYFEIYEDKEAEAALEGPGLAGLLQLAPGTSGNSRAPVSAWTCGGCRSGTNAPMAPSAPTPAGAISPPRRRTSSSCRSSSGC